MRLPQQTCTAEFKQEAVRLRETSGKRGIVIAKDLGISDTILYRWRKELRATPGAAFPGRGHQTELEEEVRRLRREVTRCARSATSSRKPPLFFCTARDEICVHYPAPEGVAREPAVSCVARITQWLLCREKARRVAPPPERSGPGSADESRIFQEGRGVSGSPRIHAALQQQGQRCRRKRVVRLMHQAGFTATRKPQKVRTTDSQQAHPIAPHLLQRDFAAQRPNEKWGGDIPGIWTQQGWLYLAGILDWYSRLVVGWAMSATRDETLVEQALHMAFQQRHPKAGLLHHTDRGSHYTSTAYRALLAERGITVSMSRKGDCWDNALMESVWATLKGECSDRYVFASHQEARLVIFAYLAVFSNRQHIHSSLGYQSPAHFEQAFAPSASFKTPYNRIMSRSVKSQ